MSTHVSPAALGRGTMLAKAACLVTTAAFVASSFAAAGSFQQRDVIKHELGAAGKKMAVVFPISSEIGPALGRIAAWSTACHDGFGLPVDLIMYVDPKDAQAFDLESRTSAHLALLDMMCFEDFNFVVAGNIYQMFTDGVVRQHFDEYDAIAVLDWKNIEVYPDSFARLYHEVFDRPHSRRWWVMAADAPPLDAREAQERHEVFENRLLGSVGDGGGGGGDDGRLVWSINGKAVVCKEVPHNTRFNVNNRSGGLRRFFRRQMSPLLRDQPFDLALWATLSFTPPTTRHWGGILLRLVSVDVLIQTSRKGPERPIFLDTSSIDWTEPDFSSGSSSSISTTFTSGTTSTTPSSSSSSSVFVDAHQGARSAGFLRREPQATIDQPPMISQQLQRQQPRQELALDESAQAPEEKLEPHAGEEEEGEEEEEDGEEEGRVRAAEAGTGRRDVQGGERSATALLPQSRLPFTDATRRGDVCAFIPAYVHQRVFVDATVDSVLRFMPGVRVAVAADPSELEEYQRDLGHLAGVKVAPSVDVKFSAVTADIRCGQGTELILYLEPGTILSRSFTEADTHDPETGELLVMYADAATAGTTRQAAFATSAEKLLAPRDLPLPLFAVGTDLLLPASANRDLRESLGLSDDRNADWEIHLVSLGRGRCESVVYVPQVLASAALLAGRPGAVFRGTPAGEEDFVGALDDGEPLQLVLKPRFGCQFYSEVYHLEEGTVPLIIGTDELYFWEDEVNKAADSLRVQLVRFLHREESCASGLIRLPRSSLTDPAGDALLGGYVEATHDYDYGFYSSMSTADGEGSDYGAGPSYFESGYDRPGGIGVTMTDSEEISYITGLSSSYGGAGYGDSVTLDDDEEDHDYYGADPSSFETGYGGYADNGAAKLLRSARQAAAAEAAAAAAAADAADGAAPPFGVSAAVATDEEHDSRSSSSGEALEGYKVENAASGPEPKLTTDYQGPDLLDGSSDSSGGGYYFAMVSRFSEEYRAASASATAAVVPSSALAAAAASADAAAGFDGGGPGAPHMSHNEGEDEAAAAGGGFSFGKARWSGFWPGVGDGVGVARVARAEES